MAAKDRQLVDQEALIRVQQQLLKDHGLSVASTSAPIDGSPPVVAATDEDRLRDSEYAVLGLPTTSIPTTGTSVETSAAEWRPQPRSRDFDFPALSPPANQSNYLVKFSLYALSWIHCTTGAYFANRADLEAVGFQPDEAETLPRLWFDAAMEALDRSHVMIHSTLEALQAICVLPMLANTFGASAYISSLLHLGIRMAVGFNFHLLGPDAGEAWVADPVGHEIGRRIWICLTTAERLLAVGRMTALARRHMIEMSSARTVQDMVRCSEAADARLVSSADFCPALTNDNDPYPKKADFDATMDPPTFDYFPWARHQLKVFVTVERIHIHRWCVGKRTDKDLVGRRKVCVECARSLIKHLGQEVPERFNKNWLSGTATFLAGAVLALEFLHGGGDVGPQDLLRAQVLEAVQILDKIPASPWNTVVPLGKSILTLMVDKPVEDLRPRPPTTTLDAAIGPANEQMILDHFIFPGQSVDSFWPQLDMSEFGWLGWQDSLRTEQDLGLDGEGQGASASGSFWESTAGWGAPFT
ncbi:hypothetical protein MNV49_006516 [Pseudohyphozyma bogoriensis]|nr:hypothetical protein MNV49_006516 [Pseudohyphozyma bogoriensis]